MAEVDFGVETKLIAKSSSTPYRGLIINRSATAKGVLSIEGSGSDIVGVELSSNLTQIDSVLTDSTLPLRELELKINAGSNQAVGILRHSGRIQKYNIKISEFIGNDQSYILKDECSETLLDHGATIEVGEKVNLEKNITYGIYSNLKDARYAFSTNTSTNSRETAIFSNDVNTDYSGMLVLDDISVQGNFSVSGKDEAVSPKGKVYGIHIVSNSQEKATKITFADNTVIKVKGNYHNTASSDATNIVIDGKNTIFDITKTLNLQAGIKGCYTDHTGILINNASLSILSSQNQKITFNTYSKPSSTSRINTSTLLELANGHLSGVLNPYVFNEESQTSESKIYAYSSVYGLKASGDSSIDGQIILQKNLFGKYTENTKTWVVSNSGNLSLKTDALIYSEDVFNGSGDYLIYSYNNKTGASIIFESGAKAIFGQEYAKLSEITQEGIYLAKDTGKIYTTSMTFKGNAGISVASGATLNMTLSSGTLEFNGSNGSQEMVAFNALQSSDPNVTQGKINLTINRLNSSIIFTKAQGGVLETFESLVSNPISSASTDKNTIVNLAGMAQDSSQSREVDGKLATRSLTIKNANIKNVNFITYVNPNISTSNVEIANFDGRAYSNPSGSVASFGASDRIIIENNLGNSGNNTFSIAIAPNQSTKNMSGYMLVGKVKTSSNLIFNDLQNGGSKNITAYSGLRTTTLTLHRSDVGDYSYYYVTSPTPPSGGGSTGGGEVGGGGSEGGNGGDEMIPPIGGGDNENNGNNGQTPPSIPLPDEGNEEVAPPPSNDNNAPVGDDNIDVPNVGVAPLTRSAFKTNFTLVSSTLNSLNKRLGDIRSLENVDGVWARVFVGEEIFKDTLQTNAVYTSIQAGYDHAIGLESDTDFIGFALAWVGSDTKSQEDSYQVSPIDFINGTNTIKTNGVELALYNTYLSHLGLYTDSIIKFGYYSSDVSMPMMESFVLDDFSFSLSQEVGYQAKLGEKKEWMITPQMEIAYAFVSGSNATQNLLMTGVDNVMDISQSASHLLRMRAGVDWGYSFDGWSEIVSKADVHLGTSYEYDVISGGEMTYSLPNMGTYKEKGMDCNGRFVLNVGTNIYIKETASIYFDFEKSFGDTLYKNYQANLGARFSFGEKIHKIQDEKTQSAPLSIPNSQQSEDQDNNQNNKE
ncbi:autotransporter outer membrane beta-barrel domain-containing protein [Helicobacter brantae]|uniref:Autotransporter domain-containing protein n=1 Tax=Helicobacter brantae TaxID=375927 RepID=A0A3D8J418_9HELI|nr:autotransporter outer membrane beta-barrel domain-containing protein [Helicobacter brantae]RDU71521.1 hypothetical protein CQA58_02965 [Helicobacter brantae]